MGAPAGSLPASSAITGGSLTGWGSALPWLPIAALPPALGAWEALARRRSVGRGCLGPSREGYGTSRMVSDGFAGAMFHWLVSLEAAEASDLQLLHARPAEDHNVPTIRAASKLTSSTLSKLRRFDVA